MESKQPKNASKSKGAKAVKGELKAKVNGVDRIYSAFYLDIIEDFKEISAAFGVRNEEGSTEDSVSLKNGMFPLVSYKLDNVSIPWKTGGTLTVKYDDISRHYSGSFKAEFNPEAYPGIPKTVTGDFEIWEE